MGAKKGSPAEIYPIFIVKRSKDLMIRGSDFYAVWDEDKGQWSTDQDDVTRMIDREMEEFKKKQGDALGSSKIMYMWNSDTGSIDKWLKYVKKQLPDNYHQLDTKLIFQNSPVKREDYSSKRLPFVRDATSINFLPS